MLDKVKIYTVLEMQLYSKIGISEYLLSQLMQIISAFLACAKNCSLLSPFSSPSKPIPIVKGALTLQRPANCH